MHRRSIILGCSQSVTFLVIGILIISFGNIRAQTQRVGVDICACQPGVYEFTLDFGLRCSAMNVQGPGIGETACVVDTQQGENVTDLAPVQVSGKLLFRQKVSIILIQSNSLANLPIQIANRNTGVRT